MLSDKKQKPIKQAAALSYSPEKDIAPMVIAIGKGQIAENIIETAEKNNIPVYRDEKLVRELNTLRIGENIPPQLYEIVAEILVFVNSIDQRYGELKNEKG